MAATYEPIATATVSGSSTTKITFNSIPSTYTDLVIVANPATGSGTGAIKLTYNNDSTSGLYSTTRLYGDGSSASSNRISNQNDIDFNYVATINSTLGNSTMICSIQNYANSTTNKTCLIRANASAYGTDALVGLWRNTAAITRVDLTLFYSSNYKADSTFTLYGIKAA